jgi:hypothetical protein
VVVNVIEKIAKNSTEFIYDTPLWKVRRLGDGWYQGETVLWAAPTVRSKDFQESRKVIEYQVGEFLADLGYFRGATA